MPGFEGQRYTHVWLDECAPEVPTFDQGLIDRTKAQAQAYLERQEAELAVLERTVLSGYVSNLLAAVQPDKGTVVPNREARRKAAKRKWR